MADGFSRCQNDHRIARSPDTPLRYRRNGQRQLAPSPPKLAPAPSKLIHSTKPPPDPLQEQLNRVRLTGRRRPALCDGSAPRRRSATIQGGNFWTHIGGHFSTPIDTRYDSCPWIFPSGRAEGPLSTIYPQWDKIRRAAAIPDVRLHDLRHSFASAAINAGVSLMLIGRLLGHALPETTARYAHLEDRSVGDAAMRVSRSLGLALEVSI